MRTSTRGQTFLEYTIILMLIIAALITMNIYMKRGLQGRWKESVDQLGEQYDIGKTNGVITSRMMSNAESRMQTISGSVNGIRGYYTRRTDSSQMQETKNVSQKVWY